MDSYGAWEYVQHRYHVPYDANRQNLKSMMTNIVGYSFHHVPPNHFSC